MGGETEEPVILSHNQFMGPKEPAVHNYASFALEVCSFLEAKTQEWGT